MNIADKLSISDKEGFKRFLEEYIQQGNGEYYASGSKKWWNNMLPKVETTIQDSKLFEKSINKIVQDDFLMRKTLLEFKEIYSEREEIHADLQNTLRKYYEFYNGKKYPIRNKQP